MRKDQRPLRGVAVEEVSDDDLLSPGRTRLSSALARFTVLFEMGRSGSTPLWSSDLTGNRAQVTGNRYEGAPLNLEEVRNWVIEHLQITVRHRLFLLPVA